MSLIAAATAPATAEITTKADGITWRVVRMPPMLQRRYGAARLVLLRTSLKAIDTDTVVVPEGTDPGTVEGRAVIADRAETLSMMLTADEHEEMDAQAAMVMQECVTHAKEEGGEWRPVRLVASGEMSEGDGQTTPDVIVYTRLAPETQAALLGAADALTTGGEQREALLQAFRR